MCLDHPVRFISEARETLMETSVHHIRVDLGYLKSLTYESTHMTL